jgi:hypothetical protein
VCMNTCSDIFIYFILVIPRGPPWLHTLVKQGTIRCHVFSSEAEGKVNEEFVHLMKRLRKVCKSVILCISLLHD